MLLLEDINRAASSLILASFARMLLDGGRVDEAQRTVDGGLALARSIGEGFYLAELVRLKGDVTLRLEGHDAEEGESFFREAIEIARGQGAKLLELRAATSLARLWRDQGKRDEARELLGPIYAWFTEGFDALDLVEAKALLDELG